MPPTPQVRTQVYPILLFSCRRQLSRSLRLLLDHNTNFLSASVGVKHQDVKIRFIDPYRDAWREIKEGGKRAVKRDVDKKALIDLCLARGDARNDLIVVRNMSQQPEHWYIQNVA